MRREVLPAERLAPWARLNNVDLNGVEISSLDNSRGSGIIATWESDNGAILINVPRDLVISLENVWIYARSDKHLLQVLEAVGEYARTARGAILVFLLFQLTNHATQGRIGVLNPFTEYVEYLPVHTSLPTFWGDAEKSVLTGTSLEAALDAKLNSLDREFTLIGETTASIDWCKQYWWDTETGSLTFDDWKQVDAMYRSRALDLPGTGHSMVPCIDMANHASGDDTTALYETDRDGNGILYLQNGRKVLVGDEITITYGDEKGACEMLFSYGFLEANMTSASELFLDLDIPEDDPLRIAKKAVSKEKTAPGFRLFFQSQSHSIGWESPFVWLLCVNEEDGLEFKLLQNNEGERELQASWKEREIAEMSQLLEILKQEPLWDVFHLRAISTLQARVEQQLFRLEGSKGYITAILEAEGLERSNYDNAMRLRDLEETLLLHAYEDFEFKKRELLESTVIQEYLAFANPHEATPPNEDFS